MPYFTTSMVDSRTQHADLNRKLIGSTEPPYEVTVEDASDNEEDALDHYQSSLPRKRGVKTVVTPTEFISDVSVTPTLPSVTRSSDITSSYKMFDESVSTITTDFTSPYTPKGSLGMGPKSIDTSPLPVGKKKTDKTALKNSPTTSKGVKSTTKGVAPSTTKKFYKKFDDEDCHFYPHSSDEQTKFSCKERTFLKYKYGAGREMKREISLQDLRKQPKVAINKACQLRIACSRHVSFTNKSAKNARTPIKQDQIGNFELQIVPPRPAPKEEPYSVPFKNNRTTKLRYMYNHLPSILRRRFGIFENLPMDGTDQLYISSKDPLTSEIKYVLDEIRYEPKVILEQGKKSAASKAPAKLVRRPDDAAEISEKRAREMELRQKRAARLEQEKRLPFRA